MSEADKIIESLKKSGKKVEEFYMSNKTSDNVANIERLNNFIEAYKQTKEQSFIVDTINKDFFFEFVDCLLAELEQKDKRIKELEEKNKHLSNVSDYETISLECVHLEEQLEIANSRIQELEEENILQRRQLNSAFDNGYIHTDKIRKLIASETINISGFECIAVEDLEELLETK